ncbi:hypothetical protein G4B88_028805 [Cannabis sativa]|uniref:CCHC-type domain-containing protein n=1 Tax=Cannabis sativa TaxID=3483 RepID=A0A7J6FSM6_CANSA|nr:hypothetical protein G4B88_028805 [Cannabis sativa]
MDIVNATNPAFNGKGKCFTRAESTIKLTPCASSQQALSTYCLVGKVIAPMTVNEDSVRDFVDKTWKFKVNVVALYETTNIPNWFELGFARADDRAWASDNGSWCVRGYTFILKAWTPRTALSISFDSTRIWIQIHNLPRDYYSAENGRILGGKLVKSSRWNWMKVLRLCGLNVNSPLFSGCFFELESGGHRWIQFKYDRIGIFCYNCGKLGHQRRGCSLSFPVTVVNELGIPYPMYGTWLSMASSYLDVFSGANSFFPSQASSSRASRVVKRRKSMPAAMNRSARSLLDRLESQKVWVPKLLAVNRQPGVSSLGNKFNVGEDDRQKGTQPLTLFNGLALGDGPNREVIGPALSSTGPAIVSKEKTKQLGFSREPCMPNRVFKCGADPIYADKKEVRGGEIDVGQEAIGPCGRDLETIGPCININGNLDNGPATTISNESSICGQELLPPHPWAIRDFPWDMEGRANVTKDAEEEPSEEVSLSNDNFNGPDEWRSKGKNVISSRPMEGTFVIEESFIIEYGMGN